MKAIQLEVWKFPIEGQKYQETIKDEKGKDIPNPQSKEEFDKTQIIEIEEAKLVFLASRYKDNKNKQAQQQQSYSLTDMLKFKRIDDAFAKALGEAVYDKDGKLVKVASKAPSRLLELDDTDFDFVFKNFKEIEWGYATKELVRVVLGLVDKFEKSKEAKPEKDGKE